MEGHYLENIHRQHWTFRLTLSQFVELGVGVVRAEVRATARGGGGGANCGGGGGVKGTGGVRVV